MTPTQIRVIWFCYGVIVTCVLMTLADRLFLRK